MHRFLNAAIGIYCEHFQEQWQEFLQPAVYSHNVSSISGVADIGPFFLVFVRNAPSLETIALDLPPHPLPQDLYVKHFVSRMKEAFMRFNAIKSDLCHQRRDLYNSQARTLHIPDGKVVLHEKTSLFICTNRFSFSFYT